MSRTKLIKNALKILCIQWPRVKTWSTLPNDILYQIELTRLESIEKGLIYLPKEIEEKVNEMLASQYNNEMLRSRRYYVENNISLNETLYCQYGVLDTELLSY